MIFQATTYTQLKKSLAKKHSRDSKSLLTKLKKLDTNFHRSISHFKFEEFNSVHFFLNEQLATLVFYLEKTKKLSSDPEVFGPMDDLIFEKWNASEFSGDFLKNLNRGLSIKEAHEATLTTFKSHLEILFERFLHSSDVTNADYRPQSSLGETGNKKPRKLLHSIITVDGKLIDLYANSLKEFKGFSARIELALKLIKLYSPTSWERFCAFTEVIIPINAPELVSYSHQELPGFSMINLYHRDFIDLLDDLLHENGHHHLNYYLNLGKLIEEPKELDYFSPWRNAPRPLRGIYHAFFTFFWAYQLFRDLLTNQDIEQELYQFSKAEWKKIHERAVEEYYMLMYSFDDLKRAKKKGLIYPAGFELVEAQYQLLKKDKKLITKLETKIGKRDLANLKKALAEAKRVTPGAQRHTQ